MEQQHYFPPLHALWIVKNARCGIAGAGENSNGIGAICPTHLEGAPGCLISAVL